MYEFLSMNKFIKLYYIPCEVTVVSFTEHSYKKRYSNVPHPAIAKPLNVLSLSTMKN